MKIIQAADLNHYGNDQMNRIYSPEGLAPTLKTVSGGGREVKVLTNGRYRKLTPKEYFRLMGFSDSDYELLAMNGISKTQIYGRKLHRGYSSGTPVQADLHTRYSEH